MEQVKQIKAGQEDSGGALADKIVNGEMEAWVANTLKRSVDARERVIA
jgi:hypothetical protein